MLWIFVKKRRRGGGPAESSESSEIESKTDTRGQVCTSHDDGRFVDPLFLLNMAALNVVQQTVQYKWEFTYYFSAAGTYLDECKSCFFIEVIFFCGVHW